jgi:glycosyltransferase involved in cell wall biosynthesis
MRDIKFDFICTVYKRTDTIEKMLLSIASQIKSENIDLTIVVDGDGLNYNDIVEPFRKYLSSINIIYLDKNYGIGYARNVGIENSHNDYVMFIDGDDQLYTHTLVVDYTDAIEKNPNAKLFIAKYYEYPRNAISDFENAMHSKCYSRKHIDKIGLRFPCVRTADDTAWNPMYKATINDNEIIKLDKLFYLYFCNTNNSITTSYNSTRQCNFDNVLDCYDSYLGKAYCFNLLLNHYGEDNIPIKALNIYSQTQLYFYVRYIHYDKKEKINNVIDKYEFVKLLGIKYYKEVTTKCLELLSKRLGFPVYIKYKDLKPDEYNWLKYIDKSTYESYENLNNFYKRESELFNEERYNELFNEFYIDKTFIE